jgi:16S rRNA (guanine(966)-N(2))-methyltransferase RsmD
LDEHRKWPEVGGKTEAGGVTVARRDQRRGKHEKAATQRELVGLRVIGGHFRGRKLLYSGDSHTRPMKDRVREAIFNLLGPAVRRSWAIDLFAGTGALGLEAISRGAARATFIERHFPTAGVIRENIATLGVGEQCEVVPSNTLVWIRQPATREALASASWQKQPWTVFCSPPYAMYVEQPDELVRLLTDLVEMAPVESRFVVEADERFDLSRLPRAGAWDVRKYDPAVVALLTIQD